MANLDAVIGLMNRPREQSEVEMLKDALQATNRLVSELSRALQASEQRLNERLDKVEDAVTTAEMTMLLAIKNQPDVEIEFDDEQAG